MRFDERTIGNFRVYAGALEGRQGDGYTAALVVEQSGTTGAREVMRDDSLACGHRWASPEEALAYAMRQARALIRTRLAAAAGSCRIAPAAGVGAGMGVGVG